MEVTIQINGQAVSIEVSYEVYEYLEESKRKTENLSHQKRRHWYMREFDEYIIATECNHIYTPTPEEILCHRETMCELMAVLVTCTEVQRERLLLYALEGKGATQIARILHDEKVERASYYLYQKGIVNYADIYDHSNTYAWSTNTIGYIIERPEFMGHTVNFRSYKDRYKDKRAKVTPKENGAIFENTHHAIVDPETWETAQRLRKTPRRTDHGEANPLTGLVFCADCGAKLHNHRQPYPKEYINEKGYHCTRAPKDIYVCSTYNLTGRRFDRKCTTHNIRTVVLRELALDAIKSVSSFVKANEAEFIRQVRESSAVQQDEAAKFHKRRITKEQKRIAEPNTLIRRIYEDNVSGYTGYERTHSQNCHHHADKPRRRGRGRGQRRKGDGVRVTA